MLRSMRKKLVLCLSLSCLSLSINSYAADSTDLGPGDMTPVKPHLAYDPTQCIDGGNIKAVLVAGNGGTGGWKEGACPVGYFPRKFKSYVGMGLNSGEFNWHFDCCKTVVTYD